jgi:hypothetical protein
MMINSSAFIRKGSSSQQTNKTRIDWMYLYIIFFALDFKRRKKLDKSTYDKIRKKYLCIYKELWTMYKVKLCEGREKMIIVTYCQGL